jgi:hypothetical protein
LQACRFGPADVQDPRLEIHLSPAQVRQLSRPLSPWGIHRRVSMARCRLDQALNLRLAQMLARPILGIGPTPWRANFVMIFLDPRTVGIKRFPQQSIAFGGRPSGGLTLSLLFSPF